MEETLKRLGMTENEAKLYIVLVKNGRMASGKIISKTGFQSSVVYHLLNSLIEKGFVSYITERKKKIFFASEPQSLKRLVEKKESEIVLLKKDLISVIRELERIREKSKDDQKVTVYSGIKGIQTVFDDILNNSKEFWNYSTRDTFTKKMPKYREYFRAMRLAKKIKQRAIITDDMKRKNKPYQEKKYVPKEFSSPISLEGYNNKVAILVWDAEPPIAVVLDGEKVSKAFKNIFDIMWRTAKE
jgi:predicted transcriptional regulator